IILGGGTEPCLRTEVAGRESRRSGGIALVSQQAADKGGVAVNVGRGREGPGVLAPVKRDVESPTGIGERRAACESDVEWAGATGQRCRCVVHGSHGGDRRGPDHALAIYRVGRVLHVDDQRGRTRETWTGVVVPT